MMNVNEIHGRQVLTQETIDDRNIIPAHLYCGSQSERNPDTFRPHTVQFCFTITPMSPAMSSMLLECRSSENEIGY